MLSDSPIHTLKKTLRQTNSLVRMVGIHSLIFAHRDDFARPLLSQLSMWFSFSEFFKIAVLLKHGIS